MSSRRDSTTSAMPMPRITAPSSTGSEYWRMSLIQRRLVGSSDR